jgi:hypothetical protein
MNGPSIFEMLSATPQDYMRGVRSREAGLQQTLAETDYKKSLSDNQRFQTEQGRAKLPYELTELSQKTDKDLFESGKSKSMAENQQATQKALHAIANATEDDLIQTFVKPLKYNDAIFTNAIQQLNSGASLQEVTQRTMSFMTKSGLKVSPELLKQMEGMASSGMSPQEAVQALSQAQVANKEAMVRADPEFIKSYLIKQVEVSGRSDNKPMELDPAVTAAITDFCSTSPDPSACFMQQAGMYKAAGVSTGGAEVFGAQRNPATGRNEIRTDTQKGNVGQGFGVRGNTPPATPPAAGNGAGVSNAPAAQLGSQLPPGLQEELMRRGLAPKQ